MTGPFAFPKSARILKRSDFLRVQQTGFKIRTSCLLATAMKNSDTDTYSRAGFTVSSKVGPAVTRNRVRRRLREAFRKSRADFPRGHDIVLIANASAANATSEKLAKEVDEVRTRLHRWVRG